MPRIAFLLPDLGGGGAERVALQLINGMSRRGFELDVVVMRRGGALEQLLPEAVRLIDLASPRMRSVVGPLRNYLLGSRPDAMLVFMWPLTALSVIARMWAGVKTRLVLTDHNTLSEQYPPNTHRYIKATVRYLYPLAEARVAVSKGVADDLALLTGIQRTSLQVIRNPVPKPAGDFDPAKALQLWPSSGKRILTVGSLKKQKNHLLLLEAFALLPSRNSAQLVVLGSGPLRATVQQRAKELGISDRVALPGFHLEPAPFYASADLFVLSSDHEGLPLVLVEALHAGLHVVSTNCPHGPEEILDGGRYGTLVPVRDAEALAAAMEAALHEPPLKKRQQKRAADFGADCAEEAYIETLLRGRRH